jgi:hypothetical protein
MVEKKRRGSGRTKTTKKKAARKSKVTASAKQPNRRKIAGKKMPAKKKRSSKASSTEVQSPEPSTLGGNVFSTVRRRSGTGTGSTSAGQAGDLEGLSRNAVVDSESVEELVEEGQAREAAAISGVEDALDPDQGELHTREVPEDDVPEEYDGQD